MCSPVPLELIASSKPLATKHPITNKWTLSRMPTEMSSQVWCFSIYFPTTWYMTDVLFLFPQAGAPVKICIKTKLLNIFFWQLTAQSWATCGAKTPVNARMAAAVSCGPTDYFGYFFGGRECFSPMPIKQSSPTKRLLVSVPALETVHKGLYVSPLEALDPAELRSTSLSPSLPSPPPIMPPACPSLPQALWSLPVHMDHRTAEKQH